MIDVSVRPATIARVHLQYSLHQSSSACFNYFLLNRLGLRLKSSSASSRWQARQNRDKFTAEARVQGLMSRAAFKLMEIDDKHRLFNKPGMTTVDLGFAPGSWSQVAVERSKPRGRVIGVDILPHKPPPGASAIQGNFLSKAVQDELKAMLLASPELGRVSQKKHVFADEVDQETNNNNTSHKDQLADSFEEIENATAALSLDDPASYIDMEKSLTQIEDNIEHTTALPTTISSSKYPVDLVLSDMCEPWPQIYGFWSRTTNHPYIRMANTTGNSFRDHGLSIDLCDAALMFALDTLKPGGKFVCKFYTGAEDKKLESRLQRAFKHVRREKPNASRSASKEMYFIGLGRLPGATRKSVFGY